MGPSTLKGWPQRLRVFRSLAHKRCQPLFAATAAARGRIAPPIRVIDAEVARKRPVLAFSVISCPLMRPARPFVGTGTVPAFRMSGCACRPARPTCLPLEKIVKFTKSALLGGLLLTCALSVTNVTLAQAFSKAPVKIGEINSYSTIPQFTQPYRQGWQLAVE